jgi:hypothetical protein
VQTRFLLQNFHDFTNTNRIGLQSISSSSSRQDYCDDEGQDSSSQQQDMDQVKINHHHQRLTPTLDDMKILQSIEALRIDDIED